MRRRASTPVRPGCGCRSDICRRRSATAGKPRRLQGGPPPRSGLGEAWWCLADLKNYVFKDAEITEMRRLLTGDVRLPRGPGAPALRARPRLRAAPRLRPGLRALRARQRAPADDAPFDIAVFEDKTRRVRASSTPASSRTAGGPATRIASPIFIVGLPRSGSTLVEQILASHSPVEGTIELPNVLTIVANSISRLPPRCLSREVPPAPARALAALGRRYVEETAPLRSGRAHFIDKMPNNFSHVGLIPAILPRAIIIDARRHPMDACFSTFKQNFAEGQSFSYDLEDLGRYYRCYRAHGPLGRGAAGQGVAFAVRGTGSRPGDAHPPLSGALRPRASSPRACLSTRPAAGAHRQRGAGAPAPVHVRGRPLATFRARARAAAARAGRAGGFADAASAAAVMNSLL